MATHKLYWILMILALLSFSATHSHAHAKEESTETTLLLSNESVQKGKQITMKIFGLEENQYPASSLRWKSSNKKIATVSSKGIVTGIGLGKAKITVSVRKTNIKLTGTIKVVSYFRTKSIKIKNKPEEAMITGSKLHVKAEVTPSRAKYKKIIWSSSKEKVATISSKGTIRAHKKGTTIITASVKGTNKKTSFKLSVKKPVRLRKITISGNSDIYVGNQTQLSATLSPSNTTYDDISWKSSNKKIATVDEQGQVYGIKAGTVTITAKEKNCHKKTKYQVHVHNIDVTSLNFDSSNIKSMETGTKYTLKLHINPGNATIKKIKWKSSNKSAATVDENGTVTALRPIESVDITATSADNKLATCTWNMKITLSKGYLTKTTLDNLDLTAINKVMITAHPDDETLWGGAHLLEDEYLVVCMTHGWNAARRVAFEQTMRTTNDKYLILNYPDIRKQLTDGTYETDQLSTCKKAMGEDIQRIVTYKKWKQIVTHNPQGEYGKYLHKQISNMVTASFKKQCNDSQELYYFGRYYNNGSNIPGEQITSELLTIKKQMVNRYYPTAKGAIKAFGHMIPYENWILNTSWKV